MIGDPTPDLNKTSAQLAANILLDIEAIHIRPDEPFTFTSGRLSPVYVDCRRIISYPRARSALMKMGISLLNHNAGVEAFDAVAGGETAGIPFAAWIAELLGLPMLCIRKQAKGFGRNACIEGTFKEGAKLKLIKEKLTNANYSITEIDKENILATKQ